jgi:DNA polymerase III alpha subunit
MTDILPIFSSHYGLFSSLLTLEEPGKTKPGNPVSVFDIAVAHSLKQVILVDDSIGGFIEAYKGACKAGAHLIFGLKLCVCANMSDKTDESAKTESNIIIFVRNSAGYSDLIRIQNRAATDGFHHHGRTDWKTLKTYWTDNLALALPFFSSFIACNLLTMSSIVPDFPVPPVLFREVDSGLPFAPMIEEALVRFADDKRLAIQNTKSIYYEKASDFDAYTVFRAIGNRGQYQRPQVDHMASDRFSFENYLSLIR